MYFEYGEKEITYLKQKDAVLGEAIDKLGMIKRETDPDLFSATINSIIGQQISISAQNTIWNRLKEKTSVTSKGILSLSLEELKSIGISYRKAEYIQGFAKLVTSGELDIESLVHMEDDEVIKELSSIKGIGVWTAEMLMLFSMQRPNIFSYGDLAILRGLRMLHHHRKIPKKLFEKYRRRYSPYCSVASLYLWAIAVGKIPGMKDYAPKKK